MELKRNAVNRVESVNERGNHAKLATISELRGEAGVRNGHIVDRPGGLLEMTAGRDVRCEMWRTYCNLHGDG